jgi:hypothetical protein
MGAFANYTAYLESLNNQAGVVFSVPTAIGVVARLTPLYRGFAIAPAIPTTSVALNNTSDVALPNLPIVSSGKLTLLGARFHSNSSSGVCVIVADILNQSGGLSGTVTTPQTTNLPTAALTRCTSGEGVMAGIIVYSSLGTTGTSVTVEYTNQNGTTGRSSTRNIGATNFREINSLLLIPLQDGDTGVRSVESVTLLASTGTAGNFGIVLFKPLSMMAFNDQSGSHVVDAVSSGGFIGALNQAESGACLSLLAIQSSSQSMTGSLLVAEV